jgi:uncharacterized protein (DUF1684 family)
MGKQQLSAKGAKDKAIRDREHADRRSSHRAESQMRRREAIKKHGKAWLIGKDWDGNTRRFVLSSHNRGGTQSKSKKDGTKAEKNA